MYEVINVKEYTMYEDFAYARIGRHVLSRLCSRECSYLMIYGDK